jgi:iron complex outermembrane receptor protein
MYGGSFTALLMAMGIAAPSFAATADATADATSDATSAAATTGASVSEVIVTGTRQTGVTAADSAAPVQVVGSSALLKTGAVDLASSLETSVPSLNIDTNGGDMAALSIQAALRGLSPNDTLVLVNGKRRHTTSNLAVDGGSPYSGSATTDLSFIPVDSIDHVEVLTDGAAAQYGTDAIAGVVNIILKKNASGGLFDATAGQFYNGQGATAGWGLNKGMTLGENGFLNVTLEERYHNSTFLGIGDRRFQDPNGNVRPGLTFPNSNVTQAQNYPHENRVNGDPEFNLYNAEVNAGYNITPDVQIYGFATIGYRLAEHYENYRSPSKVSGVTSTGTTVFPLPLGFDPLEKISELDYSMTGGIKGQLAGWDFDLATVYGRNHVDVWVVDSANAQLFPVLQAVSPTPVPAQRNFFNGAFETTQWTNTIDLDRGFDVGLAAPLNVAFGGEYRVDTFAITAGEPSSYFGGGAQSFDGYTPLDQGGHSRNNYAVYIDVATDPIEHFHVDLAGRYEKYSDFGSALVGKGTARYDFNPMIAIRGTISTGFRAPTLAEEFYSGTNVSPTSADVQLPPNSSAAALAGFRPLSPETSTNYSIGFVAHPMDHMQVTLDIFDIDLKNRIEVTNFIYGTFTFAGQATPTLISQGVLNAIAAKGVTLDTGLSYTGISVFTNASDTRTTGLDLTANYATDFGEYGHVDWTVGFNYTNTKFTHINSLPTQVTPTAAQIALTPQIASLGQSGTILGAVAQASLTQETPPEKAILQALWTLGPWAVNARGTIYGPSSEIVTNNALGNLTETIPTTGIMDLDVSYKFNNSIKLAVGATNLFNTIPPLMPQVNGAPASGALVYHVPLTFSPYGSNGGYYYGRLTITF